MEYVNFDEFKKMDLRVGTIKKVVPIDNTDKLLRCQVDFNEIDDNGEPVLRQIISGIREFFPEYENLIEKQILYIINLETRKIKGFESNGMLLAIDGLEGRPIFLIPETKVQTGAKIR